MTTSEAGPGTASSFTNLTTCALTMTRFPEPSPTSLWNVSFLEKAITRHWSDQRNNAEGGRAKLLSKSVKSVCTLTLVTPWREVSSLFGDFVAPSPIRGSVFVNRRVGEGGVEEEEDDMDAI